MGSLCSSQTRHCWASSCCRQCRRSWLPQGRTSAWLAGRSCTACCCSRFPPSCSSSTVCSACVLLHSVQLHSWSWCIEMFQVHEDLCELLQFFWRKVFAVCSCIFFFFFFYCKIICVHLALWLWVILIETAFMCHMWIFIHSVCFCAHYMHVHAWVCMRVCVSVSVCTYMHNVALS